LINARQPGVGAACIAEVVTGLRSGKAFCSWSAIHHRLSNAIFDCEVPRPAAAGLGMTLLLSANRFVQGKTVTNVPGFSGRGALRGGPSRKGDFQIAPNGGL